MKTWVWSHISRQAWCCALVITDYWDRNRRDPWSLLSKHSRLIGKLLEVGSLHRDGTWASSLASTHMSKHAPLDKCWLSVGFGRNWEDGVLKGITGRWTYLALWYTAGSLGGGQKPSREWTVECGSALGQREISEYHPYSVEWCGSTLLLRIPPYFHL